MTGTGSAGPWRNWAGDQSCTPRHRVSPRSVEEVSAAVVDAAHRGDTVRVAGAGHSFGDLVCTDGTLVSLDGLAGVLDVDSARGYARVSAGTRLHALTPMLAAHGLALPNMGGIDRQSVAGAISTATHGTGRHLGNLATQVEAMQLVLADGSVLECDAEDDETLRAARVSLGALGVATAYTLRTVPSFNLRAEVSLDDLDETIANLDANVDTNDHFEFYWFPHTRGVLTKRNNRVLAGTPLRPLGRTRAWFEDDFVSNTVFDRVNRLTTRRPALIPRANGLATHLLGARDYIDRSYRVFASPRTVRFREMEYAVPREAVPHVLTEIDAWLSRTGTQIGFPIEVRFAAADDIPLSTASGRTSGYVAVHQYHRREHEPYFRAVERIARAADGRPHWGKIHYRAAADLAPAYPSFDTYVSLRDKLDPTRMFGNAYLERVLG